MFSILWLGTLSISLLSLACCFLFLIALMQVLLLGLSRLAFLLLDQGLFIIVIGFLGCCVRTFVLI